MKNKLRLELRSGGAWHWYVLLGRNGKVMMVSETYRRRNALRAVKRTSKVLDLPWSERRN
jgi:uncharacterized protein YegP (UPF0339 family)